MIGCFRKHKTFAFSKFNLVPLGNSSNDLVICLKNGSQPINEYNGPIIRRTFVFQRSDSFESMERIKSNIFSLGNANHLRDVQLTQERRGKRYISINLLSRKKSQVEDEEKERDRREERKRRLWILTTIITVSAVAAAYYLTFQFFQSSKYTSEYIQRVPLFVSPHIEQSIIEARLVVDNLHIKEKFPGAALAVYVDGDLVWSEAFGKADIEQFVLFQPSKTVLRVENNIAKFIRACIVTLLNEEYHFLDNQGDVNNESKWYEAVMVNDVPSEGEQFGKKGDEFITLVEQFGKDFNKKYKDILLHKFFTSLVLENTFVDTYQNIIPFKGRMYHKIVPDGIPNQSIHYENCRVPRIYYDRTNNANFCTSAEDMARLANIFLLNTEEILNCKEGNHFLDNVLKKVSINTSSKVGGKADGIVIRDDATHTGSSSIVVVLPKSNIVVSMMANMDNVNLEDAAFEIADSFKTSRSMFKRIRNSIYKAKKKWIG